MLELLDVDIYIEPKTSTDLGLIRDVVNPMTGQAKQGVALLAKVMQNKGQSTEVIGFSWVDDSSIEGGPIKTSLLIHIEHPVFLLYHVQHHHVHSHLDQLCRFCGYLAGYME